MHIKVRSLFLSDLHLGKPQSKVGNLSAFLQRIEAQNIYLVGDIVDLEYLHRRGSWSADHAQIIEGLLDRAGTGTRITYLPGNHDHRLRGAPNLRFGPVTFTDRAHHEAGDGRRYLVIHGDQYDRVLQNAAWPGPIGDRFYDAAMAVDTALNRVTRPLRLGPVGFSARAKHLVKRSVNFMSRFEEVMIAELEAAGLDGIICGHVHHADLRDLQGYLYVNCGDWVESCTAVVEHFDGRFEVLSGKDGAMRSLAGMPPVAALKAS